MLARSARDVGHMPVAGGQVRLDRCRLGGELLGVAGVNIEQEQFVFPPLSVEDDDLALVQEGVRGVTELPLRLAAFRIDHVYRLELVILDSVEIPPAGPIRHHVQLAVRAPFRLKQRLVRAARDPASPSQGAI